MIEAAPPPADSVPSLATLYAALCTAQRAMPPIEKDRTADTGKFSYDYADLATILAVTTPVLTSHGLVVLQPPRVENGAAIVTTILAHVSGASIQSELAMPVADPRDPQKVGSAISYARRYAYLAILGLAAKGEDDDGARAGEPPARTRRPARRDAEPATTDAAPQEPTEYRSDPSDTRLITTKNRDGKPGGQLGRLRGLMREHAVDEKAFGAYLREKYAYAKWGEIQRRHYDEICELVQDAEFLRALAEAAAEPAGYSD